MKKAIIVVCMSTLLLSCNSKEETTTNESELKIAPIFEEFINALGRKDFTEAFQLLHPRIQNAWTFQGFSHEVGLIRESLGDRWNPTIIECGGDPSGKYRQASYHLEKDWKSLFNMYSSAANAGKGLKITKLEFTALLEKNAHLSPQVKTLVTRFVELLRQEQYEEAKSLFPDKVQPQIQTHLLKLARAVLTTGQPEQFELKQREYRTLAGGVWHDNILIIPQSDQANYLEIGAFSDGSEAKIISFNIKARAE